MMHNLKAIAAEEDIPIAEHDFTTNSREALLLAEAAKEQDRDTFYALHESLFTAFFVDGRNIGDRGVLRELAAGIGMDSDRIETAWQNEKYRQHILSNYDAARRHEIQAVPSFIFGERKLTGVVSEAVMRAAAGDLVKSDSG